MKKVFIALIVLLWPVVNAVSQSMILGGELSNSAATSVHDIDEVLPRMSLTGQSTWHAARTLR